MSGTDEFGIKKYLEPTFMKRDEFNPGNIRKYAECMFTTIHGSRYFVTKDGKITGRPSIENAKIELIGGIDPLTYHELGFCKKSRYASKDELDDLILEHGQEIRPGLILALTLTPKYVKKTSRNGMITSPLENVDHIH